MIEVFRTNVQYDLAAETIRTELCNKLPHSLVSFDLEDCDKVLRIESESLNPDIVISTLKLRGFKCEVME